MASNRNIPTIVIAGPTGSGKSTVALEIAQKINGEIICADSRTIYKDANIGTAKPTSTERQLVKHHCLDVVRLGESFSASDFKLRAQQAISGIKQKSKVPIVVGGSGLYIDGLVYDFSFKPAPSEKLRSELNNKIIDQLQKMIIAKDLPMPFNKNNKRHLIRVIETNGEQPQKKHKPDDVIYTGLNIDNQTLKTKIEHRVEQMYEDGFLDEVKALSNKFSLDLVRSAGIGYSSAVDYLDGQISLEKAKASFVKGDMMLAKRQMTWFKRNPDIVWFSSSGELKDYIINQTSKLLS